jgi:hypothetical protein
MSNVPLSSSYSSLIIPTNNISSPCLGTGRFLCSILVPALLEANGCNNIVLIQPRGTSFVNNCYSQRLPLSGAGLNYEVGTIEHSGDVITDEVGPIQNVISMARDRKLLSELIQRNAASICVIGVGWWLVFDLLMLVNYYLAVDDGYENNCAAGKFITI